MKNLTPPAASALLEADYGIAAAVSTLAKWRCLRSDGPPFIKANFRVRYLEITLRQWAEATLSPLRASTSDTEA
jgi:hypothetical protein